MGQPDVGGFNSVSYTASVNHLHATGAVFARSATAHTTGDYTNYAPALDPKKLKKNKDGVGMRESCYGGSDSVISIVFALDGTGSMAQVPHELQKNLPAIIGLLESQGHADKVDILTCIFDDEYSLEDAAFQITQFEAGFDPLLKAVNELIIPGQGGGNDGESYHLAIYAAANHTRLECWEKEEKKGFFIMVGDEPPYFDNGDWRKHGTSKEIAKSVFDDTLQAEVPMLSSLKKLAERYHVFMIRPHETSHGKNPRVQKMWVELFSEAGLNPQNVVEVKETGSIVPTMAMLIGKTLGSEEQELVEVLKTQHITGIADAVKATKAIVPVDTTVTKAAGELSVAGEGCERL